MIQLFSLSVLFSILLPLALSVLPPGCSPVGSVAGCTTWDASKYCFGCVAGYYPSGTGGCYPNNCASCSSAGQCGTCLTGFVAISGACTACPSNCDACSSSSVCTTCSSSYKIYQNQCYNPCPAITFTSGTTCLACPSNCNTCSSSSLCSVCISGFYLYNSACYNPCPPQTVISGSICADCGSNCDVCSSSSVCTTCSSGYYLYNGACHNPCPIKTYQSSASACSNCPSNCDTCSDSSTCTVCTPGYYLYNSACYNPCPAATVISGSNCVNCPSNCNVCSSSSVCTTCSPGFYLYNGVCYNPCPITTYQSSSSACSNCPSNCNTCSDGATCTVCSSSYRLYLSQCYNPCPVTTYLASTTACSNCSPNCDSCNDSSTCTACTLGHFLYNAVCYSPCPIKTYQSSASACSNCPSNCDVCNDGSTCTGCSSGYRLYLGQCYNPCPVTTYPASTTACSNCPSNCDICTDSSTCTACSLNYRLYQSQCHNPCPVTTFANGNICSNCPSHCNVCADGNTCTTCSFGYKLYQDQCYGTCPVTTYTLGTNCLDCSSYCDTCVDSNTCTVCTSGYYFYQNKCYVKCPSQAPYISPTVTPYLCFKTCPTATPYNYENLCLAQCPTEAPYLIDNVCHPESFIERIVKLGNTAASAASTGLIARSVASFSNPSLFMFGSLMKLLEYTRYMNISHSDNLEILFQTISDSSDFIPMPSMSDEMQNALETHPMPDVFARYDVPSNFLLNEGDDILALFTILSLFMMFWIMQKGVAYLRNVKHSRSLVTNARFFFQNYAIGKFYEMLGDVALAAVFEFKTFSSSDRYSWLSLSACISCLVLGAILYLANFWLIYASQKKKRENKESLKEFAEKYKGAEILFGGFKDESFLHQAAMLFFVARYILSSLVIALAYYIPLFQSAILLILSFFMVVYYFLLRPVKSKLEFVEQMSFELLLLAVNACFFIQAMCDVMQASTNSVVYSIGQTVIVLNTAFKFLPLVFLAIQLGLTLWEYYKLFKHIPKSEKTEKKKRIFKPSRSDSSISPESSHSSLQTSSGLNNSIIVQNMPAHQAQEKWETPLLSRRLIKRNLKPKSLAIKAANALPEAQKRGQIREVVQKSTLFKDL